MGVEIKIVLIFCEILGDGMSPLCVNIIYSFIVSVFCFLCEYFYKTIYIKEGR